MAVLHLSGENYTKSENPKSTNIIVAGTWGGKVRIQYDVVATQTSDIGGTFKMGKLPAGATFLQAFIIFGALGATVKSSLGDGTTVDLFMVATISHNNTLMARKAAGVGHRVTVETDLVITTSVAVIADAKPIQMVTFYSLE